MKHVISIAGLLALTACTSNPVMVEDSVSMNRSVAGDNKHGKTNHLFGDCTIKTINRVLGLGTWPNTYPEFKADSYDIPNQSGSGGKKEASKFQVIYMNRIATAVDGSHHQIQEGKVEDEGIYKFYLRDGTSKEDCKIMKSRNDNPGDFSVSAEQARNDKPAGAHPYFQDPCMLDSINHILQYFTKNNPNKGVLESNTSTRDFKFLTSYRNVDETNKQVETLIYNLLIDNFATMVQYRGEKSSDGRTCVLSNMQFKKDWADVPLK